MSRLEFWVERFVIRAARIAFGLAFGGGAAAIGLYVIDLLSKPFPEQSPISIIGGIGLGIVVLWMLVFAFGSAFGEGEPYETWKERRTREREARLGR